MQNLNSKFIILHNIIERPANKDVNIEVIRRAMDGFNWQKAFSNKNVNNILSNFITIQQYAMKQ